MRIIRNFFLLLLGWVAGGTLLQAEVQDAFLDQPLPSRLLPFLQHPSPGPDLKAYEALEIHSYGDLARLIRSASPKPVIFPAGWINFVKKQEEGMDWNKGQSFFLHLGGYRCFEGTVSTRQYLTTAFDQAGLTWKYDALRDVIMTDFPWRTDDSRSNGDLLRILCTTRPAPVRFPVASDAWKSAFDALLSKPENFPRAWQLRFSADNRFVMSLTDRIENMVAKAIRDTSGKEHILFVNDQPEMGNPGPPGSISYYLFDPRGKFESGGICTIGYRCFQDSAWIDGRNGRLHVRTYNNGSEMRDSIYELSGGILQRTDYLINGSAPSLWQWSGLDSGKTIFNTMGG